MQVYRYDPAMVRPMREELTRLGFRELLTPDDVDSAMSTAFAGMELDAVERVRTYFIGYLPSSPQITLFKDGKLAHMMERQNIEGRSAEQIAGEL